MEVIYKFLVMWQEASVATQRGIICLFLSPLLFLTVMGIVEKIIEIIEGR